MRRKNGINARKSSTRTTTSTVMWAPPTFGNEYLWGDWDKATSNTSLQVRSEHRRAPLRLVGPRPLGRGQPLWRSRRQRHLPMLGKLPFMVGCVEHSLSLSLCFYLSLALSLLVRASRLHGGGCCQAIRQRNYKTRDTLSTKSEAQ